MQQTAPTLAIGGVDTAENGPPKVRQVTNKIRRNLATLSDTFCACWKRLNRNGSFSVLRLDRDTEMRISTPSRFYAFLAFSWADLFCLFFLLCSVVSR